MNPIDSQYSGYHCNIEHTLYSSAYFACYSFVACEYLLISARTMKSVCEQAMGEKSEKMYFDFLRG